MYNNALFLNSFDPSTSSAHKLGNGINKVNGERQFKNSNKPEELPSSKSNSRWLPSQVMRDVLDSNELIFRRVRGYVQIC